MVVLIELNLRMVAIKRFAIYMQYYWKVFEISGRCRIHVFRVVAIGGATVVENVLSFLRIMTWRISVVEYVFL